MKFDADNPTWVIEEFERMVATSPDSPAHVEILRTIVNAAPSYRGPIWKGLEKRPLIRGQFSGKLSALAKSVRRGLQPRQGDAILTPKEKEALASRLALAAREFAKAWRAVSAVGGEMPRQITSEIDIAYFEWVTSEEPYASWTMGRLGQDTLDKGIPHEILQRLDTYAIAAAAGADKWATAKVPLAKPNHPNADRLWFIRVVTESLHYYFGAPMREEVLALTNIWFGDTGMTANALSEIAKLSDLPECWPPRISQIPTRRD